MSTGSQGEPMSALGRMATGDHRHITIASGDTVVLASSLVPGNETSVYRVINRLSRAGATVVHKETAKVHVSGHAPAGELLFLLNVVRPSNLMPVHGEWRHLRAHAQLGIESGVAPDRVVLCEDGDVVDLVEGHARHVGRVKNRYVYVDGLAVGDVSESLLTERRILGDGGFISATVVIDSVTGKVVGEPSVSAKGFSEDPEAFSPVIPLLTAALHRSAEDGITDPHQLQQVVRRTVGPLGERRVPPAADDRADRRRSLSSFQPSAGLVRTSGHGAAPTAPVARGVPQMQRRRIAVAAAVVAAAGAAVAFTLPSMAGTTSQRDHTAAPTTGRVAPQFSPR